MILYRIILRFLRYLLKCFPYLLLFIYYSIRLIMLHVYVYIYFFIYLLYINYSFRNVIISISTF